MRSFNVINMALGTLALDTTIFQATKLDAARIQGSRPKHIEYMIEYQNKTAPDGPLVYGLCEGLTVNECGQFFGSDPQYGDDPDSQDDSTRHIIILGYIPLNASANTADRLGRTPMHRRRWPGWELIAQEPNGLNFFVHNLGAALTTGTEVDGVVNLRGDWIDK